MIIGAGRRMPQPGFPRWTRPIRVLGLAYPFADGRDKIGALCRLSAPAISVPWPRSGCWASPTLPVAAHRANAMGLRLVGSTLESEDEVHDPRGVQV